MPDVPDRRALLATALLAGTSAVSIPSAAAATRRKADAGKTAQANELGVVPDAPADQSVVLQAAIDQAALNGVALALPPGRFRAQGLKLRAGSHITGSVRTVLQLAGEGPLLTGDGAHRASLERIRLEGGPAAAQRDVQSGLLELHGSHLIVIEGVTVVRAGSNGILLSRCSGRVVSCDITGAAAAGLMSLDGAGLEIAGNTVSDCSDNGILVWRSSAGEDGTLVAHNRISNIGAASGGSGQYGNGINVFRAGNVRVTGNAIADCAYTAIRGNQASNLQMVANSAMRLGEVALYAEFAFEGAVIAQNIVDGAAAGISVTNFNEGGRLAVIQGNIIRNLRRREHEPEDKRGEGIAIEADAAVSGNTIEGAPSAGIVVGWGRFMRDVAVTGNVIRASRVGIMITRDPLAGGCLVAQNLISGARDGAVRLMDLGVVSGDDLTQVPSRSERLLVTGNHVTRGSP